MRSKHRYSQAEIDGLYRAIAERRDMRHFVNAPLEEGVLARLLQAANQAPSVGLMQPWRFIRITEPTLRGEIKAMVEQERQTTAACLEARKDTFLKLKVEGILECAELLVVALPDDRERHVFGRRTMPDMDLASVSCAIQNMWLAARAEGIGLGWVSLFEPKQLAELLAMPEGSRTVAILCIGHVEAFYQQPMLVEEQWITPQPLASLLYENSWPSK